jgi:hypothetical protein
VATNRKNKKRSARSVKPTMKNHGFLGLVQLNHENAPEEFHKLIIIKCRNPIFKTYLYSNPQHYKTFIRRDINSYRFTHLWQELAVWSTQIIQFKDKINNFLISKEIVENNILLGNNNLALQELEVIKESVGLSYWYVQTKLSLLSMMENDSEVLKIYKHLFKDSNRPVEERDLDILLSNASKDRTVERNNYSFEAIIEGLGSDEGKALEFLFRFEPLKFQEEDFSAICEYLFPANIIDKYLAFSRMAMVCLAKNDDESEVVQSYISLDGYISDYKIRNIKRLTEGDLSLHDEDKAMVDICDTYMYGDFNKVIEKCEGYLMKWPHLSNAYEFYVNSLIALDKENIFPDGSLLNQIIISMQRFILGRGEISFSILSRTFQQFNNFDLVSLVKLIELKNNICHDQYHVSALYRYLDINGSTFNPFRSEFPDKNSVSYIIANSEFDVIDTLSIPQYRKLKWNADKLFSNEKFELALESYKAIDQCPMHLKDEIRAKIALSMIKSGDCQSTVNYITDLYFEDPKNVWKLPKELLFKEINESELIDFDSIDTVICIYLLLKDNYTEHQAISLYLKDYLMQFKIKFPSELRPSCPKQKFILLNICDLSILEGLNIYHSNNEKILDRVKILSTLVMEDNEEESVKEELDLMAHQYTKNSCVKKLGKGKLHVDQSRVFAAAKKALNPVFNDLCIELEKEKQIVPQEAKESISTKQNNQKIVRTDRKAFNLALFIMMEVRDIYTLNPTYGLDNSLNVDIRHNGIVPRLRSVFDKHDLLCRQLDGEYLDNDFIEECFKASLTNAYYGKLQDAFKDFSKSVNVFLSRIKNSYMQIGTDDLTSIDSLFKFTFESDEVHKMLSLIQSNSSLDEIIKWIINNLDRKAEMLIEAGKVIMVNLLPTKIDKYFKELKSVSSDLKRNAYRVNEKISLAKIDLISTTNEVSCWLDFVKSSGEHFSISVPVLEALNFVEKLFPKVKITLSKRNHISNIFDGLHLKNFIRVFIMLFENAVSRRKYNNTCELNFDWIEVKGESKLTVTSISKEIDLIKVKEINDTVNNISYLEKANRDNNSGFFKIKRIFEQDLITKNSIYLFVKDETFNVEINFTNKGILKRD